VKTGRRPHRTEDTARLDPPSAPSNSVKWDGLISTDSAGAQGAASGLGALPARCPLRVLAALRWGWPHTAPACPPAPAPLPRRAGRIAAGPGSAGWAAVRGGGTTDPAPSSQEEGSSDREVGTTPSTLNGSERKGVPY